MHALVSGDQLLTVLVSAATTVCVWSLLERRRRR